ncbi:MAG: hypothetical protein GC145_02605 [Caulobacter sp.]|nr:hypothetical protein [Caulobacter sp.]
MFRKRLLVAATMLIASASPAFASTGANSASSTFRIHGFVPVICRVAVTGSVGQPDPDGVISLGVADEFCNAPRGYRVIVEHTPSLHGAALIRNGVRIPLSESGETVLTDSSHADINQVALALDVGDDGAQLQTLSIRIEAKA